MMREKKLIEEHDCAEFGIWRLGEDDEQAS
jgi:hypothetical protein